jgi:glycerophosphoryl diester phosphodiesterase
LHDTPARGPGPLVIAHGAANIPAGLSGLGGVADVVEADVRRFWGRLEVRHAKSVGPLPLFWDEGRLLAPTLERTGLEQVLAAVGPELELMLDLKGPDPRMARDVLRATADWRARRPLLVCARAWRTADRLRGAPGLSVLHSVGDARGLRRLLRRYPAGSLEGVSIHVRLLSRVVVETLRERTTTHLWTWPVDDEDRAPRLVEWGVTGLISNTPARLAGIRRAREPSGL